MINSNLKSEIYLVKINYYQNLLNEMSHLNSENIDYVKAQRNKFKYIAKYNNLIGGDTFGQRYNGYNGMANNFITLKLHIYSFSGKDTSKVIQKIDRTKKFNNYINNIINFLPKDINIKEKENLNMTFDKLYTNNKGKYKYNYGEMIFNYILVYFIDTIQKKLDEINNCSTLDISCNMKKRTFKQEIKELKNYFSDSKSIEKMENTHIEIIKQKINQYLTTYYKDNIPIDTFINTTIKNAIENYNKIDSFLWGKYVSAATQYDITFNDLYEHHKNDDDENEKNNLTLSIFI